jgi:CheY-like chemotaxis protein
MRVLVVEDSATTQGFLRDVLGRDGHEVAYATDGRGALAQLSIRRPDVVLLDWVLGGDVQGGDVLRELRLDPATRAVPVIVLTASGELTPGDLEGLGPIELLYKPAAWGEVADAVARAASGTSRG